jgi:hypothetical protein
MCELKGKADDVLHEMIEGVTKDGRRLDKPRGAQPEHVRQISATIGAARRFDWGEVAVCQHCWRILGWDRFPDLFNVEWDAETCGHMMPAPWSDSLFCCPWCPTTTRAGLLPSRPARLRLDLLLVALVAAHDQGVLRLARRAGLPARARRPGVGAVALRAGHAAAAAGPLPVVAQALRPVLASRVVPPRLAGSSRASASLTRDLIRTTLAESHAVEHARSLRPHYDLDAIRQRVLETWSS